MGTVAQLAQRAISVPSRSNKSGLVIPIEFAKQVTKDTLRTAIDMVLTEGGDTYRYHMYLTMAHYMYLYRLDQADLGDVVVEYSSKRGLTIEAKLVIYGDNCPGCGVRIYTKPENFSERPVKLLHFNTATGYYSYGCARCHSIFKKWEGIGDD